jgi:glutamate racemase
VYQNHIQRLNKNIDLKAMATPLLVPMIEEGFFNNRISDEIIEKYLDDDYLKGISAIILGCTHYPLIRKQVQAFFKENVDVLDSSDITAVFLENILKEKGLLAAQHDRDDIFLVSDYTESFEASTKLFFREKVELIKYTLWE